MSRPDKSMDPYVAGRDPLTTLERCWTVHRESVTRATGNENLIPLSVLDSLHFFGNSELHFVRTYCKTVKEKAELYSYPIKNESINYQIYNWVNESVLPKLRETAFKCIFEKDFIDASVGDVQFLKNQLGNLADNFSNYFNRLLTKYLGYYSPNLSPYRFHL